MPQRKNAKREPLEREIRNSIQVAKLADRTTLDFLAAVSHEFRTPLNAIIGFSEILSDRRFGPIGEEKLREYARDIHASSRDLLKVLDDMLNLSAIEAGRYSPIRESLSIKKVVEDCSWSVMESASKRGIDFLTSVPNDLPPLYADKSAVKQVVLNLVFSAIRFSTRGGTVVLSVRASKDRHTIEVSNTVRGAPAPDTVMLADSVVRNDTDPYLNYSETSLELMVTKSLVEILGGKLNVESAPGKGRTSTVTLPTEGS